MEKGQPRKTASEKSVCLPMRLRLPPTSYEKSQSPHKKVHPSNSLLSRDHVGQQFYSNGRFARSRSSGDGEMDEVLTRSLWHSGGRSEVILSMVRPRIRNVGDCHGHCHEFASTSDGIDTENGRPLFLRNNHDRHGTVLLLLLSSTRTQGASD